MLYEKKVRYLDHYEGGVRVGSSGFAKIEVRDSSFRMDLTVKGLHPTDSFTREVMLCGAGKEAVLGSIVIEKGAGMFRHVCHIRGQIDKTGVSYEEWSGIRIFLGGSREINCRWEPLKKDSRISGKGQIPPGEKTVLEETEAPGDETDGKKSKEPPKRKGLWKETERKKQEELPMRGSFREEKERGKQEELPMRGDLWEEAERGKQEELPMRGGFREEEERGKQEEAPMRGSLWQEAERGKQEELPMRGGMREEAGREKAQEAMEIKSSEVRSAVAKETDREMKRDKALDRRVPSEEIGLAKSGVSARRISTGGSMPDKEAELRRRPASDRETVGTAAKKKMQSRYINLQEDKWKQLSSIYPHIQPFQDNRDYLSLGPADFVLFPAKCYKAVNNSFLLHGYYNYHHLLLAKVEKRGETVYYVGVPGNYYEKEKQVAIMFGFESFECAEEPAQTGDFGYYMMRVEI